MGPGFGCTSPDSRKRRPSVVAALMSNELAFPLQTDSNPENRRENDLEEVVGNDFQVDLTVTPLVCYCLWNQGKLYMEGLGDGKEIVRL